MSRMGCGLLAGVLVVGTIVSSVHLSHERSDRERESAAIEADRDAKSAADMSPTMMGTLVPLREWESEDFAISYGGTGDRRLDLASIEPACKADAAFVQAVASVMPVGARVMVVRKPDDEEGRFQDAGYVYLLAKGADHPREDAPSVNEMLVRVGVAQPRIISSRSGTGQDAASVTTEMRGNLAPEEFERWQRLQDAYADALAAGIGPLGECSLSSSR